MRGNGFQQLARNLIGISVKKTHPAQPLSLCQSRQQQCQSVFQSEVFAIAGGVLADKGDFAYSIGGQPLGFSYYGFKMAGAELAAKLGNDAEAARMITAFCNLEIRRSLRSGQDARRVLVVEIVGQVS